MQSRVGTRSGPESGSRQGRGHPAIGQGLGISRGLAQGLSQPSSCPGLGSDQALPDTWLKPQPSPCTDPSSGFGPVRALIPSLGALLEMSSSSPRVTRRAGCRARAALLRGLT